MCRLQSALNRFERCRGAACPFWEEGGAVVPASCMLARLEIDLERRPELASALVHVRCRFDQASDAQDEAEACALLFRLVPGARDEVD